MKKTTSAKKAAAAAEPEVRVKTVKVRHYGEVYDIVKLTDKTVRYQVAEGIYVIAPLSSVELISE